MLSPGGRPSERFREWIDEQLAQRQPGARLPTACECAAQWDLSRSTVTRILSEYRRKGLIVRIPRRGTFLADAAAPPPSPRPSTAHPFRPLQTIFAPTFHGGPCVAATCSLPLNS